MTRTLCPTEAQEQLTLAEYLDTRGDLLWLHIPNERKANPRYVAKLKRLGMKKGAPDVLVFKRFKIDWHTGGVISSPREYLGLAIELKRQRGGVMSVEQKWWLDDLGYAGWFSTSCRGAAEAIKVIEECYGDPGVRK